MNQYNIDYDCFNSVYKVDMSTDSAKQITEEKKRKKALEKKQKKKSKKTEKEKRKAKTDDEGDTDIKKNGNAQLLGGSSPSLMMAPQAFPVYYAPYPYPRNIGQAPTLSTPLLWPPQPQPMASYSNSSPVPARYTHRRRMTNHESSSPGPSSNSGQTLIVKSDREATTPERQYWIV